MTSNDESPNRDRVGPVLNSSGVAQAVLAAIVELNPDVRFVDRGAYVRVLARGRCIVTKLAIEKHAARSVVFPAELEAIMPSFKGFLSLDDERAVWEFGQ